MTVTGQVTIPKAIRDRPGLVPGSRVAVRIEADGTVVLRKAEATAATANRSGCPPGRAPAGSRLPGRATAGLSTGGIMATTRGKARGKD